MKNTGIMKSICLGIHVTSLKFNINNLGDPDILQCVKNSEYLLQKLNNEGMNAWRNNNSLVVVTDKMHDQIAKNGKYLTKRIYHILL